MSDIKFSSDEKAQIVAQIKRYFDKELGQDIGQFDAEFLLDFFSQKIGPYYYNRGLYDAKAVINDKLLDIDDALFEIEKSPDTSV